MNAFYLNASFGFFFVVFFLIVACSFQLLLGQVW